MIINPKKRNSVRFSPRKAAPRNAVTSGLADVKACVREAPISWIAIVFASKAKMLPTIPVMILFLTLQRFLEEGLTAGSVKG